MAQGGWATHFIGKWDCGAATPLHTPYGRNYSTALNYFGHGNYQWGEQEWNGAFRPVLLLGASGPAPAAHPLARVRCVGWAWGSRSVASSVCWAPAKRRPPWEQLRPICAELLRPLPAQRTPHAPRGVGWRHDRLPRVLASTAHRTPEGELVVVGGGGGEQAQQAQQTQAGDLTHHRASLPVHTLLLFNSDLWINDQPATVLANYSAHHNGGVYVLQSHSSSLFAPILPFPSFDGRPVTVCPSTFHGTNTARGATQR